VAVGRLLGGGEGLRDFFGPPSELGSGHAGIAHFIDHIVHLAAKGIKSRDRGAARWWQEEEGVIKAAASLRGFLLDVLLGSHGLELSQSLISHRQSAPENDEAVPLAKLGALRERAMLKPSDFFNDSQPALDHAAQFQAQAPAVKAFDLPAHSIR
jgi:hypothetical protein